MKADTVDLAAIFGKQVRYLVPLFQRPYVWNEVDQWQPLWEDVRAVADRQLDDTPLNDAIPHFLGAVVLEQALVQSGMIESRFVIDGQQRLTTLQLLLAAARAVAAEHQLDEPRQMFETLLFNQAFLVRHDGDELKVVPTKGDRVAFRESMQDGAAPKSDHRIHKAFHFFRTAILEWMKDGDALVSPRVRMEALSTSLWKQVLVVTIDLDPGDNAQIIFETLNARGTPLLAADLIKNHLFQVATIQGAAIDALYEKHWEGLDSDWWREDVQQGRLRRPRLDIFLNHWLAMRTGTEVVSHQLFPEFKRYLADGQKKAEAVLIDLERYARVYESWENEPGQTNLGQFLYRLSVMEVTTAYPALLWLLGPEGIDDPAEQQMGLAAIESWLVRRMLIRATTKNYNVVFLALLNAVRPNEDGHRPKGADVAAYLAGLTGESQSWPVAGEVLASLRSLPIYTSITRSRLRMMLEALELASHTGFTEHVILPHDLTIEHVLPQEWKPNWPLPDSEDPIRARSLRDAAKQTLGNLTLVTDKLNPSMSNAGWIQKRDALRKRSVMSISADIRDAEKWDESAIAERGNRLAMLAISVWPRPDDVFEVPSTSRTVLPSISTAASGVPLPSIGGPITDSRGALGVRYQSFFTEIVRRFNILRPGLVSYRPVGTINWYQFSARRSGFALVWSVAAKTRFRVELYVDVGNADQNRAYLEELRQHSAELEAAVDERIDWEPLEMKRACRLSIYRPVERDTMDHDGELMDWAANTMARFADAILPLIQSLKSLPANS